MASITDDIQNASEWIARALTSSGYRADFSPASLWEIDRLFDDHSEGGKARPGGLLAQDLGSRIFAIGSYIGEVMRRARGGQWVGDDTDPQVEMNVTLRLPDSVDCWPVQRAMKRFKNGPEDGIAAWGSALGLDVGALSPPRAKGFFARLFGR